MNNELSFLSASQFLEAYAQSESGDNGTVKSTTKRNSDGSVAVGMLWGEFKKQEFEDAPQMLFGIRKGNVGMLIAETNVGKTTLALNLAVTLSANSKFPPIINEQFGGVRVMYIDGESTQAETQRDIARMMRDWNPKECESVDENLMVLCDEEFDGESLDLSHHISVIKSRARDFGPDLIVVDTMAALFALSEENNNAEVKNKVMQPLKDLARESNSAVLLLHHIGKPKGEEGSTTATAYKGRGASNFGCLARSVVVLTCPNKSDKERVVLSVPKSKGYYLDDVAMRLDKDARWFIPTNEVIAKTSTCVELVADFVRSETPTAQVIKEFEGRYKQRTIEDALHEAYKTGRLARPRHGYYAPIETTISAPSYSESATVELEQLTH